MIYRVIGVFALVTIVNTAAFADNWYALAEYEFKEVNAEGFDSYDVSNGARMFIHASAYGIELLGTNFGMSGYVDSSFHSQSEEDSVNSKITEAYFSDNIDYSYYFNIGKKKQLTGTAFFRSPTDFFYPNLQSIDKQIASAFDEKREGVLGIGASYLGENFSISNYFSPAVSVSGHEILDDRVGLSQPYWQNQVKANYRLWDVDITMIYHLHEDKEGDYVEKFGLNVVTFVSDNIELHFDSSLNELDDRFVMSDQGVASEEVCWFTQAAAGFNYTVNKNVNIIGELYFNGYGLDGQEYDRFLSVGRGLANDGSHPDPRLTYGTFNVAREYLMGQISYKSDFSAIEFNMFGILNMEDKSGFVALNVTHRLSGNFSVVGRIGRFHGNSETESDLYRERARASLAVEYYY